MNSTGIEMKPVRNALLMLVAAVACAVIAAPTTEADAEAGDRAALNRTMATVCSAPVVLLGEATHGDGHSDAVKAALIKRMVSECGFNGVLFESSYYEFQPIAQRVRDGKPVEPDLIGAAMGAYWKYDRELQPLFQFLAARALAGQVQLGGLDFQAGGFEQPYANDVMITELTSQLPIARRESCKLLYRTRVYGEDPPNGMSERERTEGLQACLREAESGVNTEQRHQIRNLQAWLDAAGGSVQQLIRSRDQMMAENVIRFIERKGKAAKVVIWTANGHAARSTTGLGDYGNSPNLGSLLSQRYGSNVFSLGITACGGEYRWSFGTNKPIEEPPSESLEARHCTGHAKESVFVGARLLREAQTYVAGMFGHAYKSANWADAFDGVLVLNVEYAPHSSRQR